MNCGVSTTPWGSVSRPRRARVRPSAGGGVTTSNDAGRDGASTAVTSPRCRTRLVPQRDDLGLGAARRRDLVAEAREVVARRLGRDPALRRPIQEPEAQEVRLVARPRSSRSPRTARRRGPPTPTGPERELLDDRGQELPVGGVEARVVDLEEAHGLDGRGLVDRARPDDLGVVADPLQQPVHDPRRAPPPPRDRHAPQRGRSRCPRIPADRSTISVSSASS